MPGTINSEKNTAQKSPFPSFIRIKSFKQALNCVKGNILLILSLYSLILLQMKYDTAGIIAALIALIMIPAAFSQFPDIKKRLRAVPVYIKIYSVITTAGICFFSGMIAYKMHLGTNKFESLAALAGVDAAAAYKIPIYFLAAFSGISVYALCALFIDHISREMSFAVSKLTKAEKAVYAAIIMLSFAYIVFVFTRSRVFWGGRVSDLIYTSDSAKIVRNNAYLRLLHIENDIRQPLFAVFAAPFVGFGYALSLPFMFFSDTVSALAAAELTNMVQIILLTASVFLISVSAGMKPSERILFMLVFSSTYMYLLFTVMMEQYIVCVFWLVFAIYSYCKDGKTKNIYLTAAGGTLLTSFAFIPLCAEWDPPRRAARFIRGCLDNMLYFLAAMLCACRSDIFVNTYRKYSHLSNFMAGRSFAEKACQYSSFVASCFIRPSEAVIYDAGKDIKWIIDPVVSEHLNAVGIAIIILCAAGFILDRKNKFTVISGLWCLFSAALLLFAGWGSAENGMILYSLYFGWAFLWLVFALMRRLSALTGSKALLPVLCALLIICMAVLNFNGISDLIAFGSEYYPVFA